MKMITAAQAAQKWNMSVRNVQDLCRRGRIPGISRIGGVWMIPWDAQRPADGRSRSRGAEPNEPLLRKSPFLDMTDLYSTPGGGEAAIHALDFHPEAQTLLTAQLAYRQGDIDKVYGYARYLLHKHSGFYAILSAGMLLGLCAMWKGDMNMWMEARKHICEAPAQNQTEQDIMALSLACIDSAVRNTENYPQWFIRGNFEKLPADAHPAARVFYVKYLLILAQDVAAGKFTTPDVMGLGFIKSIPYITEPMVTQAVVDGLVMVEIHLRLLCAVAYHQAGDHISAAEHLDRAVRLCLADGLYGVLVEYRRQLGLFLDERIALQDAEASRIVKEQHKQMHIGWTKLHNAIMEKTVSIQLAAREREVARLVAYGLSDAQIAKQLSISESSVKSLIRSVRNKTGVESRRDFALYV